MLFTENNIINVSCAVLLEHCQHLITFYSFTNLKFAIFGSKPLKYQS